MAPSLAAPTLTVPTSVAPTSAALTSAASISAAPTSTKPISRAFFFAPPSSTAEWTASELTDDYSGRKSSVAAAVMLEAASLAGTSGYE